MPSLRPSPEALLNPCIDPIFKILFTQESEESRTALTCFLSDILQKTVTDVVLQPNELSGEAFSDKQSEFDINCKIDGKIVNIEMQGQNNNFDYGKRAEYHVAHLLNHYTPKGKDWIDIPQVYQISVLNFIYDNKTTNAVNHYTLKTPESAKLEEILNVIFLELPKIKECSDDISKLTKAQMWGKFFLYASKEEKKDYIAQLAKSNRGIHMAVTVLKDVSQDEMNWYHESRYWMHVSDEISAHNAAVRMGHAEGLEQGLAEGKAKGLAEGLAEGLEQGLAEGKAKGLAEGKHETQIQIAKNMLAAGLDPKLISTTTGLSPDEINDLKN